MNHIIDVNKLKNIYFALRHGESEANEGKIIISDPKNGINEYGLTEKGKSKVESTILKLKSDGILDERTNIYSSDFRRAKETAEISQKLLNTGAIEFDARLRERYFGGFEKLSSTNYDFVGMEDTKNPEHKINDVESANEVLNRTKSLIYELERKYSAQKILLVSHGDPIQILHTWFIKTSAGEHSRIPGFNPIEPGEVRRFN